MPADEIDLLAIERGTVTAPAGCGKTHLIADALTRHTDAKPILVLTHTNAGVVALRGRLDRAGVPSKAYRLSTIDGWAMRLISTFPTRSNHNPEIIKQVNPAVDYPNIRVAAVNLLKAGHVSDILAASYALLIVDEYQDCSIRQHGIVGYAAQTLQTCVLGDPMQAIFGFGNDNLAKWEEHVCAYFPLAGELTTPWRWINADAEPLGRWLLEARGRLCAGNRLISAQLLLLSRGSSSMVRRITRGAWLLPECAPHTTMGAFSSSATVRTRKASDSLRVKTPGAITVEAVDLKDLVSFASNFNLGAPDALERLARFGQSVMTNVGAADLVQRVQSLTRGTARNPPTDVEQSALAFVRTPSHRAAVDLLAEISKEGGVRTHRPAVLRACMKALLLCGSDGVNFHDAAIRMREQNRLVGRPLPMRAVGSTLLLKGLEAEVVVVLNAVELDARNLYVAITRGSKALMICSPTPILNPH